MRKGRGATEAGIAGGAICLEIRCATVPDRRDRDVPKQNAPLARGVSNHCKRCLLYTSDAADERSSVDLGGRRIIKKKNKEYIEGDRKIEIKIKQTHKDNND